MADRNLRFLIGAQDNASDQFAKVGDSAESMSSKIGGAVSKLGDKIGGELGEVISKVGEGIEKLGENGVSMGAKMTAAGVGIAGLGVALQTLGSGEKQASQQLDASIKATGESVDDYSDQIDKAISKGEDFGHSGVDVQNALQKLVTVTGDTSKALAQMSLVEDIAAYKHTSLADAADQVNKLLAGNAKAFKAYGIILDTTIPKQDAIAQGLQQVADKMNGQASAASDTFSGKIDSLKEHAIGFAEDIGNKFGPALTYIGTGLGIVGSAVEIYGAHAEAAAAKQELLNAADAVGAQASKDLAAGTITAAEAENIQAASAEKAAAAQGGSKLAMLGTTTGALGLAAAVVYGSSKLAEYIDRNKIGMDVYLDSAKAMGSLNEAYQKDSNIVGENTAQVIKSQLEQNGLADKAAKAGITIGQLTTAVGGNADEFKALIDTWQKSGKISDDTQLALLAMYDRTHNLTAATSDLADTTDAASQDTTILSTSADDAADALKVQDDAVNTLSGDLKDLSNGSLDASANADKFQKSLIDLTAGVKDNGRAIDGNTTGAIANRDNIRQSIQAAEDYASSQTALKVPIDQVTATLNGNMAQLEQTAIKSGMSKTAFEQLIAQMHLTPTNINTAVTVDIQQAFNALNTLQQKWAFIQGQAGNAGVYANLATQYNELAHPHAAGGAINSGFVMDTMNENGIEGLKLPSGTTVIPHGQTEQQMRNAGTGGGGVTYNISVSTPQVYGGTSVELGRQIAAELSRYLNTGGTVSGRGGRQIF